MHSKLGSCLSQYVIGLTAMAQNVPFKDFSPTWHTFQNYPIVNFESQSPSIDSNQFNIGLSDRHCVFAGETTKVEQAWIPPWIVFLNHSAIVVIDEHNDLIHDERTRITPFPSITPQLKALDTMASPYSSFLKAHRHLRIFSLVKSTLRGRLISTGAFQRHQGIDHEAWRQSPSLPP